MKKFLVPALSLIFLLAACNQNPKLEGTLKTQDFGTAGDDTAFEVTANSKGAFVIGFTKGSLDGPNKGDYDGFIRRYDGGVVWAQQFGTRFLDLAFYLTTTDAGDSYVLGLTDGALGFKLGGRDIFLRKYNVNGALQWTRQFGTSGTDDNADIALDSNNNIYTLTQDGANGSFVIRKWNSSGTVLQTIRNTTTFFCACWFTLDSLGNIYVSATLEVSGKLVARLYKYSSSGTLVFQKNVYVSSSNAITGDIKTDSANNLYILIGDDAIGKGLYLRKLDSNGTTLWTRLLESNSTNGGEFEGLAIDGSNNIYVTSETAGAFPGFSNAGGYDVSVLKYNASGTRLWASQFGGNGNDHSYGIAVSDAVYVAGSSSSNPNLVGDPNYGASDAYLAQLDPSTGALLGIDQ